MRTWLRDSPYRAVGVYIGGSDRACSQVNLSAAWVSAEAAAGWHFLPLYVGPQASFGELTWPASQAISAAQDAVIQARLLGFGPHTPIYYDMEAYSPGAEFGGPALLHLLDQGTACPWLPVRDLQQLAVRCHRSRQQLRESRRHDA